MFSVRSKSLTSTRYAPHSPGTGHPRTGAVSLDLQQIQEMVHKPPKHTTIATPLCKRLPQGPLAKQRLSYRGAGLRKLLVLHASTFRPYCHSRASHSARVSHQTFVGAECWCIVHSPHFPDGPASDPLSDGTQPSRHSFICCKFRFFHINFYDRIYLSILSASQSFAGE